MSAAVIGVPAWKQLPNGKKDRLGMLCPHCGGDTGIIDTRPKCNSIRRRRVCFGCGQRLTTFEVATDTNPALWLANASDRLRKQAAELRAAAERIERALDTEP